MPCHYMSELLTVINSVITFSSKHEEARSKNNQTNSKDTRLGHRFFQEYLRKNGVKHDAKTSCDREKGLVPNT